MQTVIFFKEFSQQPHNYCRELPCPKNDENHDGAMYENADSQKL